MDIYDKSIRYVIESSINKKKKTVGYIETLDTISNATNIDYGSVQGLEDCCNCLAALLVNGYMYVSATFCVRSMGTCSLPSKLCAPGGHSQLSYTCVRLVEGIKAHPPHR